MTRSVLGIRPGRNAHYYQKYNNGGGRAKGELPIKEE